MPPYVSQRHAAAHAVPHQNDAAQVQCLDDIVQILRHIVVGVADRRDVRFSKAAQVHQDRAVSRLDQQIGLIFEQVMGHRPPMEEQDGFPAMGIRVIDGDLDPAGAYVKHLSSPHEQGMRKIEALTVLDRQNLKSGRFTGGFRSNRRPVVIKQVIAADEILQDFIELCK